MLDALAEALRADRSAALVVDGVLDGVTEVDGCLVGKAGASRSIRF